MAGWFQDEPYLSMELRIISSLRMQEEAVGYRRGLRNFRLVSGLRGGALPAVLEPVALPVHLQDVEVVGEPVQQRSRQSF